jgi:predicted site-specific integrase-resolvase
MSESAASRDRSRDWMTPKQAAFYLGVSPFTMALWRKSNKAPSWHRMHGRIRYTRADLDQWINATRHG